MSSNNAGVDFNNDPIGSALNVATQYFTYGTVGYGDGGFKKGIVSDLAINATKEVTGAKAAEEANAIARQQFEEQKAKALQDRENAKLAAERNQIIASQAAGSAKTVGAPKRVTSGTPIGDSKDYLGL